MLCLPYRVFAGLVHTLFFIPFSASPFHDSIIQDVRMHWKIAFGVRAKVLLFPSMPSFPYPFLAVK
jgi:hypothetical protein